MPTKEDRLRFENVDESFERCKKLHDEMKKTIEGAYEKAKIDPKQVTEFFSDPSHFSPDDWRKLQAAKSKYRTQFRKFLPKEALEEKKKPEKKQKRAKKGYAERKRWLSMD